MNNITPMPWHYEEAQPEDRQAGIWKTPVRIYGETLIKVPAYNQRAEWDLYESILIADLQDPVYQLPLELWTSVELAKTNEYNGDYPRGYRQLGTPEENARRIVAAVNATKEWSTEELEKISFLDVVHRLYTDIDYLKHIIHEYELNFKERGDIWDTGKYDEDSGESAK